MIKIDPHVDDKTDDATLFRRRWAKNFPSNNKHDFITITN